MVTDRTPVSPGPASKPAGAFILDQRDDDKRLTARGQRLLEGVRITLLRTATVLRFSIVLGAVWWTFGLLVAPYEPRRSPEQRLEQSRGSIEACILSSIKDDLAFFTRHGYLSYGGYREIVGACNALSAHIDTFGQKADPRNTLSHTPSLADLSDRHPRFRRQIEAYVRLTHLHR